LSISVMGVGETLNKILDLLRVAFPRNLEMVPSSLIPKGFLSGELRVYPSLVLSETWEEEEKFLFLTKKVKIFNPVIAVGTEVYTGGRSYQQLGLEYWVWGQNWDKVSNQEEIENLLDQLAKVNNLRGVYKTTITRKGEKILGA